MGTTSIVVVALAVVIYAALSIAAFRNPLLARVAAREAIRRPFQSLLVVAGLTVGTAAILGPQIWSDSGADSLISAAYRSWGRVDITVSGGGSFFETDVASRLTADRTIRNSVAGVQAGVELVGSVDSLDQLLNAPVVRLVGFDPAAQPAFGAYVLDDGTGTFGEGLASGEVLVSRSLADSLQAKPGDRIRVLIEGRATDVSVAAIASPDGPGAYGLRPALFMPLSTAQSMIGSDLINVIRITAFGDGQAEEEGARAAAPGIRAVLATATGGPALEVREVKADEVAAFNKQLDDTRAFTLSLGLLVMAVGSALVVNLILSLADERRPRLAVLRALGLSRSGLVMLSMLEGALYSLAAALVSLVIGAVIVWVMFAYAADANLADVNGRDIAIGPSVRPGTVAAAVAFGTMITLLTVFVAAVRASRLTIASAIKDMPERESARRRSWIELVGLVALALAGFVALAAGDMPVRFIGGLAVILVVSSLIRGRMPERTRATLGGGLVTAWGVATLSTGAYGAVELAVGLELYLLGTVTLVFGLSILISANLRLLETWAGLLGNVSSGFRATLRPPLAYMTRRPTRAGLTIGALGLVVAMVTSLTVLGSAIGSVDDERDTGGFDVEVSSAGSQRVELPASVQAHVVRSVSLSTRRYLGRQRAARPGGAVTIDWHEQLVPLYELSDDLIRNPLARLSSRDPRFSSDAEVWRTVGSDPTWVISNWGGQGASLWLDGREGPVELKVAGTFAPGLLDGIAGSPQALAPFADLPTGTTILVQAQPGTDPGALALEIRRATFSEGVEASTTKALLDEGQVQGRTWLSIFRTLILIGLVVGVLSLGVLSLRAVLERRRAIGVLRALGYQSRSILAGIMIEASLTIALGIAVGMASGLAATYFVFEAASVTAPIPVVDVGAAVSSLGIIYAALFSLTLVVSSGPALRASRLTPIEALRVMD